MQAIVQAPAIRPDRRKHIGRVEPPVPVELEQVPMKTIGPRFRHRIDRRTRVNAVLGGQAARRQLELLQRIREGQRQAGGGGRIVVHRAVEQVGHAEPLPPGHRDVHAALKAAGVRLAGLDGRAR